MDIIITVVKGIHIIISILLIITVLLQPGKGDDLGTIFGGTTQSIFGASGAVPFLTKMTRILAVLFMATSLSLGYLSAKGIRSSVVEESNPAPTNKELVIPPKEQTSTSSKSESSTSPETEQKSTPSKSKQQTPQSESKPQEKTNK